MGRKKIPTHLKIVKGTNRKDRENKNEPFPETEIPEIPDYLSEEAIKEWNIMAPLLAQNGLITKIDKASFAIYCQSWGLMVQAEKALAKEGLTVTFPSGAKNQNPLIGIINTARKHVAEHLANFGMSPAHRAKVVAKKSEESKNPFAKFGS